MIKKKNSEGHKEICGENVQSYCVNLHEDFKTIEDIVNDRLQYYIKKANFYKQWFYVISGLNLVLNASISVLIQVGGSGSGKSFQGIGIVISTLSNLMLVLSGILSLFRMRDSWYRYRKYAEALKLEQIRFLGNSEIYRDKTLKEKSAVFTDQIYWLFMEEQSQWQSSILKVIESNQKSDKKENGES